MTALLLRTPRQRRIAGLLAVALAVLLLALLHAWQPPTPPATRLALLLPDDVAADDVRVSAWRDAAAETGFLLETVTASQLLRDAGSGRDVALILPDGLHRRMNDALLAHLTRRVEGGALLLLVHDAGVEDMTGIYHPQQSRLSALAGVRFALYGELGTAMLREQPVAVDPQALPLLQLPPGKLVREPGGHPLTSAQPAPAASETLALTSYIYGPPRYPAFVTRGRFDGSVLIHGEPGNVLAGVRRAGRGQVLFVNLPLTYLKLRTDGLLLHALLRCFAQDMAQLPQLAPMPDARGALVMNWHIDAAAALPAMDKLSALGAFEQGPYSVHLTAGPDVDVPGDGLGIALADNPRMRDWVRRFAERGDEIGSHGGWIHNEFGRVIGSQAPARSQALIDANTEVVRQASGRPVREYSAPTGNHPAWVTRWLRERGVRAYYFTGDIGLPPTRSYQDGRRGPPDMWAYPVLSYGSVAAFEEAAHAEVPESELAAWLNDVSDYCASNRTVRLVYFHPPGIALYPQAFGSWLQHTRTLVAEGRLRWTTMAAQADFANRRLQVQWALAGEHGATVLRAHQPEGAGTLAQMSWLLPAGRWAAPQVTEGRAAVARDGAFWRVTAEAVPALAFKLLPLGAKDAG